MTRLIALVLVLAACNSRLKLDVPRAYHCTEDGGDECAGTWVCNVTAGVCFDPDAGAALPCSTDDDCGTWRCGPTGVCVDGRVEGEVTRLPLLDAGGFVSPKFPGNPRQVSEPAFVQTSAQMVLGTDVLIEFDGGRTWLEVEDQMTSEGTQTQYRYGLLPGEGAAALTTCAGDDAGIVHLAWVPLDGGVVLVSDRDGNRTNTLLPGAWSPVSDVRGPFGTFSHCGTAGGAVIARNGNSSVLFQAPDGTPRTLLPGTTSIALVPKTSFGIVSGQLVNLDDGGLWAKDVEDLHVAGGTWLAWRTRDSIWWADVTHPEYREQLELCRGSDGGTSGWNLWAQGATAVPVQYCDNGGYTSIQLGRSASRAVADLLAVSSGGSTTWTRSRRAGSIGRTTLAIEPAEITLQRPPEAMVSVNGDHLALSHREVYVPSALGYLVTRTFVEVSNMPGAGQDDLLLTRGGMVYRGKELVAYSATTWGAAKAPLLLRTVSLADGGTLIAAAHDDTLEVAELGPTAVELIPAVLPMPGIPVSALALTASDAGLAHGYAVAGGNVVALSAASSRRWTTSRINLPYDVLSTAHSHAP